MRFMMLVIQENPNSYAEDSMPDPEGVERMAAYNERLMKQDVLLSMDGLYPHVTGARVTFQGGVATTTDGPFTEAKEAIGGYWIIDVTSREEAIQWALQAPMDDGFSIEVRRIFEFSEFPQEIQAAAAGEGEMLAELQARRATALGR